MKSSTSELAKVFGGTIGASNTSQTNSPSQQRKEQKSSVSETAKRFGNIKPPTPSVPPKPSPAMEDQTLTFTFDNVDGEFSEMKLSRSVEKLDQPEDDDKPQSFPVKPSTTSSITAKTSSGASSKQDKTPEFHPSNKPPKQPETQQPGQCAIKKLDMSKYAVFGKSIND